LGFHPSSGVGSGERVEEKMDMDEYQAAAGQTAVYGERFRAVYPALGLASEAGEVAGKVKKVLRDQEGKFDPASTLAIADELGDVLWYVAVLAADLGLSLDRIASENLEKLRSRQARGRLSGEGDRR
jgi:NTP pyrophosphatase (non-canonical NTP hydrolase)